MLKLIKALCAKPVTVCTSIAMLLASSAAAQTPPGAAATQWDIAASTGSIPGVADSTSTMRNVVSVVVDETRNRVFFTTRTGGSGGTGGAKLGELDPATNSLIEWRFGSGLSTTAGMPSGLAWSAATGEVWMGASTTSAGVVLRRSEDGGGNVSFVKLTSTEFTGVFTPNAPSSMALAPDGTAAFFTNTAGDMLRVTRTGVGSQKIAIGSTGGAVRHVTVEANGTTLVALWYTRPNGTIGRLRPVGGNWDKTEWIAPAQTPNSLPPAEAAASLFVRRGAGANGDALVCAAVEGPAIGDIASSTRLAPFSTGEIRCLDAGTSRMLRLIPLQAGYPRFITTNSRGELFFTESGQDALSFLAPSVVTAAAATTGAFEAFTQAGPSAITASGLTVAQTSLIETTATPTTTVTNFRKMVRGTVPVTSGTIGAFNAGVGYVRFNLPLAGLHSPRPNSISAVAGATATQPGMVFVGESFMDPVGSPVSPSSNARITRLVFGEPASSQAAYTACLKRVAVPAPATCAETNVIDEIAISGTGTPVSYLLTLGSSGTALAWQARKQNSQGWLDLSATSGNTASSGAVTLTLDHVNPPVGSSSLAFTEILTIDDDPADESAGNETGAAPVTVTISLTVDPPPAINLANANSLSFHEPTAGDAVTFQVQNLGGGSLRWTAMSNNPGFVSVTQAGQVNRFGEMDLAVTVVTTPQVTEAHEATIYICTDAPNAGAPPPGIALEFACPHVPGGPGGGPLAVHVSTTQPQQVPPSLALALQGAPFSIEAGATQTQTRTLTITKHGSEAATDWMIWNGVQGVDAPIAALPAWLTVSPPSGTVANGLPSQLTITLNPALIPANTFGDLRATLRIGNADGNDSNPPYQDIEVMLTVTVPAPVITVPSPLVLEATGPAGATASYSVSATDVFNSAVAVTCAPASGSAFALGTSTVSCTADDTYGNSATTTFTVTVRDTTAPGVPVLTSSLTIEAGTNQVFTATATDLVDASVNVSCSPASTTGFGYGSHTVSCTATDDAGNTSSASFTINVVDTTAPVLNVPSGITQEALSVLGLTINFAGLVTVADVTAPVTVSCNPASGALFAVGTTTVSCTATDGAGNQTTRTFPVTVTLNLDSVPPVITVPLSVTAPATGASGAVVTYGASAVDLVSGTVPVSCTPASGATFPLGTTTVTCTAADAAGNGASKTFTVTVNDTVAPTITGTPGNQTAQATSAAGAAVNYTAPTASDLVDGPRAVSCSPASGSTFSFGTTTVTCTSSDSRGNTATTSFTVTVNDTTAPVITGTPLNVTDEATSAAGRVVSFAAPTASDVVDGARTVSCSPASGSTFPLGTTPVVCTSSDSRGNTATTTFTVTVQDTTAPALTLPSNQTIAAPTSSGAIYSYTASASDLVDGNRTVICSTASGSLFPVGTTTVNCSATDTRGFGAAGSFAVTTTYTPPAATFNVAAQLYYKTGRLAFCNGVAVGPNWKDQGLVITNTGTTALSYALTTPTSWVNIATTSGTIAAGASATVTVSVNISGLARGVHYGSLVVTGNGSVAKTVPVAVEIGNAPPTLCLTPTNTPLGTVGSGKSSTTKYFDVLNVGDDTLGAWSLTRTASNGTVTTTVASGTGVKSAIGVSVKAGTLKGNHTGKVTVTATGVQNSGTAVNLSWTVK